MIHCQQSEDGVLTQEYVAGRRTDRYSGGRLCRRAARLSRHAARESISLAENHQTELQEQRILCQDQTRRCK